MWTARILAFLALAAGLATAGEPELKTENEKILYAIGLAMSQQVSHFSLTPHELAVVTEGFNDGVLKKQPKVDLKTYGPKIADLGRSRAIAGAGDEKKKGAEFVAKVAGEKGTKKTDSGLLYLEYTAGTGDSPKPTDTVKLHYTGKLIDGTIFDTSLDRGEPVKFAMNAVIKCWAEALQMMKVGAKARVVCPPELAYGDAGVPAKNIPGGATLVYFFQLVDIEK